MNLLQNHIYYFVLTSGMSFSEDFTIECLQTSLDDNVRFVKQIEYESLTEKFFITYVRRLTLDTTRIEVTSSTPLCALIKTTISNSVLFLAVEKTVGVTFTGTNYIHIPIISSISEFDSDKIYTLTPSTDYAIVNISAIKTMNLINYPYHPLIVNNNTITLNINDLIDMAFGDGLQSYSITFNVVSISLSSFTLVLYQNNAENNRVDKSSFLTYIGNESGTLRESCNIVNPIITIEYSQVPNFNYVWIPSLNRYYFLKSIVSLSKDLWVLSLTEDVLMTYNELIRQQHAFIERNEFTFNIDSIDEEIKYDYPKKIEHTFVVDDLDLFDGSGTVYDSNNNPIGLESNFGCVMVVVRS